MKFSYTILYVKDVTHAVAFYERAFNLKQRFIHESGQYAEMETGGTTLAFASNELARSNFPQGFQENNYISDFIYFIPEVFWNWAF
ncbi:VOC family protein [Scytonema millei]|uniref:VOC family protein n=1 Tax=Scytonema millei TaxID=1245922 RepID=UPI00068AFD20|nr:VOC family protein [Scytonema millei]